MAFAKGTLYQKTGLTDFYDFRLLVLQTKKVLYNSQVMSELGLNDDLSGVYAEGTYMHTG